MSDSSDENEAAPALPENGGEPPEPHSPEADATAVLASAFGYASGEVRGVDVSAADDGAADEDALNDGASDDDASEGAAQGDTAVLEGAAVTAAPFLTATGLSARGHQGAVFTGIDLHAELGQIVAVSGDGGDGRSSLLLALAGRFAVSAGTLIVDGRSRPGDIRRRFTVAQAGTVIGFDEYHTVADCIKETVTVSGGAATRHNIAAWLDRLAVHLDSGDTFGFVPRLEQLRFAIACAAAARTPAIVVDDADTGLNDAGGELVFEALRTVADAGQLVLTACDRHDPPADTVVDLRGNHFENGGRK